MRQTAQSLRRRVRSWTRVDELPTNGSATTRVDCAGDCRSATVRLCARVGGRRSAVGGARAVGRAGRPAGDSVRRRSGEGIAWRRRPLATLLPGKLAEVVRLPETGPLEHFANSEATDRRPARGRRIRVPRLADVTGKIEVYAGRQAERFAARGAVARGLGRNRVCRASISTKPPLADWPGADCVSASAVAAVSGE